MTKLGRLYQVEYAMEAISHAGTSIGIQTSEGLVLAAEKKVFSKLIESKRAVEKIYRLSEYGKILLKSDIICCVAGITSDANILIDNARLTAQRHLYAYNEPMPVEQLVQSICNLKQSYTQHGGMRPFGASFLYGGYDAVYGFQLYHSDPSGNYSGWKATCIGTNFNAAQSILKSEYKDSFSLEDATFLAIKVLSKTMDTTTISPEKGANLF